MNSKQKGKRFELSLASRFREYGYQARRSAQYCGSSGEAADVVGLPGIHVEAKHQERMQLYEWMAQAVRDHREGTLPAVFHKANNKDLLVTMRFDDWMTIYNNSDFPDKEGDHAVDSDQV
jgi:Holliday junction resolvase